MTTYTITLTDAEVKAMEYVALSVQEWADNSLKHRASQAIEEVYELEVQRMQEDPDISSIPTDKNQVVLDADIKSAAQREKERAAEVAAALG